MRPCKVAGGLPAGGAAVLFRLLTVRPERPFVGIRSLGEGAAGQLAIKCPGGPWRSLATSVAPPGGPRVGRPLGVHVVCILGKKVTCFQGFLRTDNFVQRFSHVFVFTPRAVRRLGRGFFLRPFWGHRRWFLWIDLGLPHLTESSAVRVFVCVCVRACV